MNQDHIFCSGASSAESGVWGLGCISNLHLLYIFPKSTWICSHSKFASWTRILHTEADIIILLGKRWQILYVIKQWHCVFFVTGGRGKPACWEWAVFLFCGDAGCSFFLSDTVKMTCCCTQSCSPVNSKFSEAPLRMQNPEPLSSTSYSFIVFSLVSLCVGWFVCLFVLLVS